jgi:hypothetical protein
MCILSIMRCQVPNRLIRICLHTFNFLMLASVISDSYMDGNAHDPAIQVLGHVRLVTLLFSLMEISFKCRAVCTATHVFLMARMNHNLFMNSGLSLSLSLSLSLFLYIYIFILVFFIFFQTVSYKSVRNMSPNDRYV